MVAIIKCDYRNLDLEKITIPDEIVRPQEFSKWLPEHCKSFVAGRYLLYSWIKKQGLKIPKPFWLEKATHGKPYLQGINFHFNIAHSHGILYLIVAPYETGIDVEIIKKRKTPISEWGKVFNPKEMEWMQSDGVENEIIRFFRLWTIHEALVKTTGKGLQGLGEFDICPTFNSIGSDTLIGNIYSANYSDYAIAFYLKDASEITNIEWLNFSLVQGEFRKAIAPKDYDVLRLENN